MSYIIRDIKLSKLTRTPMSEEASRVLEFWDNLWSDMKVSINIEKGEIKCWKEGYNFYYIVQRDKNDKLLCDYDKVWSFFVDELELEYEEIQELMRHMVSGTLNCVVNTPVTIG